VFIDYRIASELKSRRPIDVSQRPSPQQPDSTRVKRPDQLAISDGRAPYDHWFCLRHGSTYDPPGRILQRPAPLNLAAPPCNFTGATTIKIG
jgi:Rieske Fe-S protein